MASHVRARGVEETPNSGQLLDETRNSSDRIYCTVDKQKYNWRPEFDDYLKAHYWGGITCCFQIPNRITSVPRWHKHQATRLGLTMHIDRKPWIRAGFRTAFKARAGMAELAGNRRYAVLGREHQWWWVTEIRESKLAMRMYFALEHCCNLLATAPLVCQLMVIPGSLWPRFEAHPSASTEVLRNIGRVYCYRYC